MSWTIEFERRAAKEFDRLDQQTQVRIKRYFEQRILSSDSPRQLGKALKGKQSSLWSYRIGPCRVVVDIRDSKLIILVVRVGHRREVYR